MASCDIIMATTVRSATIMNPPMVPETSRGNPTRASAVTSSRCHWPPGRHTPERRRVSSAPADEMTPRNTAP